MDFRQKHRKIILFLLALVLSFLLGYTTLGAYIRGYAAGQTHPHYGLADRGGTISFHILD